MIYKNLVNVPDTIQPTAFIPPPKAPRSSQHAAARTQALLAKEADR